MPETRNVNGYVAPALTVDALVVDAEQAVLLVRRGNDPFKGTWALPGGFVDVGERTEDAVVRELLEETGVLGRVIRLHGVYSDPARDPRGHTVSVVYLVERTGGTLAGADDAVDAAYFPLTDLPPLAFDHAEILRDYRRKAGLGGP